MAEKVVSVRLQALIDTYEKNMKRAGETTEKVAKADRWKQMGQATASLGDSLTSRLTVPIVGVGIAAIKMAGDVDAVFTQMQSLAGVAADEVAGMKDQVLDLAGETGKAPKELAEALYFLRSSGLDASDAMDALEMSAKASAAGMGSTVAIADAVSSAMNAYAKSGLTAAEATDVLVATAREGKAEPAELAKQMGRLLPLSSELGISFQDVGAALAALSLSGNDAAGASTLLSNIMSKLLKPSQQAAESMAAVGISTDSIREMIEEKGLLGTLETLRASLGDAGFAKFLEDAQAVQGGLALTGENIEKNREIFDNLNDSVGATEQAFEKWGRSIGAQNAQAWGEMQAAMVRLGDVLAPLAADLMSFGAATVRWFLDLPGPVQKAIGGLVAFLAVLGPILSTVGRVQQAVGAGLKVRDWVRNLDTATRSIDGTTTAMGKLKNAAVLGGIATAIAGIGLAVKAHFDEKNRQAIEGMAEGFASMGDEITDSFGQEKIQELMEFGQVEKVFKQLLETNTEAARRFIEGAEAAGVQKSAIDDMRGAVERKIEADAQATIDSEAHADAVEEAAGAFDEETTAITQTVEALSALSDALTAQFDPLFGLMDASNGVRDARVAVEEATRKLAEAEKEHGKDSQEAADAARDLSDAHEGAVQAALAFEQAEIALAAGIEDGTVKLEDAIATLDDWVARGLITRAEADASAAKFRVYAGSVDGLSESIRGVPTHTSTTIRSNAVAAREAIDTVRRKFEALDGKVYSVRFKTIYETVQEGSRGGPGFRLHEGGYVPGQRGQEIAGLLLGGEEVLHWDDPRHSSNLGKLVPSHLLSNLTPHSSFAGAGPSTYVDNRTFTVYTGADPQGVVEALKRYNRDNGPVPVTVRSR